ncbi:hypothetical protein KQI63_01345 [bacterium]|nr:hypothetical protein [bacterium]
MYRSRLLIAATLLVFLTGAATPSCAQEGTAAVDTNRTAKSADGSVSLRGKVSQDSTRTIRIDHGVMVSKSPTGALFRSLAIPGWGQLYTGHPVKAVVFLGTDIGMLYGIYVQNNLYEDYLDQAGDTKDDSYRARLEDLADFYRDDRNKLIWWTAGVMLLSGFDAYVEAHLYDFRIEPMLGTTPSGTGVTTGLRITF